MPARAAVTGHSEKIMQAPTYHALITGGTGGLGKAIAEALAAPGWSIAAPGSRELDVRDPAQVRCYFDGRDIDLLVCAAGITRDASLGRLSEEAWDETWSVNFTGALSCIRAVLSNMIERGFGHIVLISSFSALRPPRGQAPYAAAKAALLGLVADLATQHGSSNVRINAVLPGFLETAMTSGITPERREQILADHTLGRFNTCAHAAEFIRFLHHQMPNTSGQVFQLDSRIAPM
jgi:3-oxoacyl-[acyl-carrier protein] reductase